MLRFSFEKFQVDVFDDKTFGADSADNVGRYDYVYFSPELGRFLPSAVYGIKISGGNTVGKSAIVAGSGGGTSVNLQSVLLDRDRLLLCCANHVFCLTLPTLELLWKRQADPATCFQIFCLPDGYIVHGELQICKLDRQGELIWEYAGADIFVAMNGSSGCVLHDSHIELTDFNGETYQIDYAGKTLYHSGLK